MNTKRLPWMGLAKLVEESAEVIQVCAKLNACPDGIYFDGKDLIAWLENELADLSAIMQFVEYHNEINVDSKRVETKYKLFCEWYGTRLNESLRGDETETDRAADTEPAMAMPKGIVYGSCTEVCKDEYHSDHCKRRRNNG